MNLSPSNIMFGSLVQLGIAIFYVETSTFII